MHKQMLKGAHQELFRRTPDETFDSLESLITHCNAVKYQCTDRWHRPQELSATPFDRSLDLEMDGGGMFRLNDWSFSQLCTLARVNKDTVNRLSPETASQVFRETLPGGNKPLQILTDENTVRSIHGASYTRLWNADLLDVVKDFSGDFQPPQKAITGGTGLYAGEQDAFVFMIDPAGWVDIDGEAFAPGFYAWNSEVGKRSVGISTFWFQAVCANHLIWDCVDVNHVQRKHTANVHDALADIRMTLEQLVKKRDERKDGFAAVMQTAMRQKLGDDAEEVEKLLNKRGITRNLAKKALRIAEEKGAFTIFAIVDALTRLAGEVHNAGERVEIDQKASALLELAV